MVNGGPRVLGKYGSVHANLDLMIYGDPLIDKHATASGDYIVTGGPLIGGKSGGGYPKVYVPEIDPANYRGMADYVLRDNGDVYDRFGVQVATGAFGGWVWTSAKGNKAAKWTCSTSDPLGNKTYYIEGDAFVSGNPGGIGNPWVVTILATGNIDVSGNPKMQTNETAGSGLIFVAGGDLKIEGNPDQRYEGHILVREQFIISGTPRLNGALIAKDAEFTSGLVSEAELAGDMNITYNGGALIPDEDSVAILGWHEVLQ